VIQEATAVLAMISFHSICTHANVRTYCWMKFDEEVPCNWGTANETYSETSLP
jgi:hypothetical protein